MEVDPIEAFFSNEYKQASELCDEFFYRYLRYQVNFSMALFYSTDALDAEVFKSNLRRSDKFLPLQYNLFCTVFDMTTQEEGLKASENILYAHEAKHFSKQLFISFASTQEYPTQSDLKSHLFSFLNFAIKEDRTNQIIDGFYELERI